MINVYNANEQLHLFCAPWGVVLDWFVVPPWVYAVHPIFNCVVLPHSGYIRISITQKPFTSKWKKEM